MKIVFVPCQIVGSGYAGKSGVAPLYRGLVAAALERGELSFAALAAAEAKAYAALERGGNFPGYIPTLKRVVIDA